MPGKSSQNVVQQLEEVKKKLNLLGKSQFILIYFERKGYLASR